MILALIVVTLSVVLAVANAATCEDNGTNKAKCLSSSEDGVKCA